MVNIGLWTNYLTGRGVSADKITKLNTSGNGKIDDIKVDLTDGLNSDELKALGITASTIDFVIDDNWKLGDAGSARNSGAIDIQEADLVSAEVGMKEWADIHNIPIEKARLIYYAEPTAVHRENNASITSARDSAISALIADKGLWKNYETWKNDASNTETDKSFKNFLIKEKKVATDLAWLDGNVPVSAKDLVRLAYISSLSDKAQEAYLGAGRKIIIKYTPIGDGIYDAKQIEEWILTSKQIPTPPPATTASTAPTTPTPKSQIETYGDTVKSVYGEYLEIMQKLVSSATDSVFVGNKIAAVSVECLRIQNLVVEMSKIATGLDGLMTEAEREKTVADAKVIAEKVPKILKSIKENIQA